MFRYQGGRKLLVASHQGRGFIVPEDECLGNTRKGKQVLNVKPPDAACAVAPVDGELVAAIGENRKMLVFPIEQMPDMARGRGVRLQRHKDGGLSDIKTFEVEKGLSWTDSAGRAFNLSLKELADWRGNRADAGRLAPKGFPKTNKFRQYRRPAGEWIWPGRGVKPPILALCWEFSLFKAVLLIGLGRPRPSRVRG